MNRRSFRASLVAAVVLVVAAILVGLLVAASCGARGPDRWCEEDATDRRVDNAMCANAVPGFEWETAEGKARKYRKPATIQTSARTPVPPVASPKPTAAAPTTVRPLVTKPNPPVAPAKPTARR